MSKLFKHTIDAKKLILFLIILLLPLGCKQKEETPKTEDEQTKQSEDVSKAKQPPQTEEQSAVPPEEISSDKKILATVNGRPIYKEDLKGRKLEYVIVDEILYEEGLRRGLDKTYEKQIENYKKSLILRPLKQEMRSTLPKEKPTNEEIENFYKQHERKYTNLKVIELSVNNKNLAEKIHKRAIKGDDFEKIASSYPDSEVRVSPKPFFLFTSKNDYFESFKIGTVSNIDQENGNFLIYKIVNVDKLPLSRIKTSIVHSVLAKKQFQAISDFAEKAKKEHNIKVEIIQEEK